MVGAVAAWSSATAVVDSVSPTPGSRPVASAAQQSPEWAPCLRRIVGIGQYSRLCFHNPPRMLLVSALGRGSRFLARLVAIPGIDGSGSSDVAGRTDAGTLMLTLFLSVERLVGVYVRTGRSSGRSRAADGRLLAGRGIWPPWSGQFCHARVGAANCRRHGLKRIVAVSSYRRNLARAA